MRVAIFIPAFNAAHTISETLSSVAACEQFVESGISVHISDNASEDHTCLVARNAWTLPVPLNIVKQPMNLGVSGNLNWGLQTLSLDHDWAFVLNADDVVKKNWLSLFLPRMRDCGAEVATICSSYDTWYPQEGRIDPGEDRLDRPVELIPGTRDAVLGTLKSGCWWHISGCAIRLQAFKTVGHLRDDLPQSGDWDWLLRALAAGWCVEYIPRTTLLYRQHTRSVSTHAFRTGRDFRDRLSVIARFHRLGFLSKRDLRTAERSIAYQVARRAAGRAMRLDWEGLAYLAPLLARTLAQNAWPFR